MRVIENIKERWFDAQAVGNSWISLGFHIDHKDPSLTLHLPGVILSVGWLKQPGFPHSLRRRLPYNDDIPGWTELNERAAEAEERREAFEECAKRRRLARTSEVVCKDG